ncbi:MAG: helix-turn-helix domain-containing protein [Dehalococcoidia bacterium]|nr:helix-turn-helix domain-containing protein [Dehalococcoidia bacterium]
MSQLDIRFTTAPNGEQIAFVIIGRGPVIIRPPSSLGLSDFQNAPWVGQLAQSLAPDYTLVVYDHLGSGLSGKEHYDYSLEGMVAELAAVGGAVGEPALIWCVGGAGPLGIVYAARYPDRVSGMGNAGWIRGRDFVATSWFRSFRPVLESDWDFAIEAFARIRGQNAGERAETLIEVFRRATTPEAYRAYLDGVATHDATAFLPSIHTPTLVLHNEGPVEKVEWATEKLHSMPGARRIVTREHADFNDFPSIGRLIRQFAEELGLRRTPQQEPQSQLSARECEVLVLLAAGLSNAQIADHLGRSPRTIDRHVQNVFKKINAHNRTEAALWARDHGAA